jgi:hypothetical protein
VKEVVQAVAISQRLKTSFLGDAKNYREEIVKLIEESKLDEAIEEITSIMKKATSQLKTKKTKHWFDANLYKKKEGCPRKSGKSEDKKMQENAEGISQTKERIQNIPETKKEAESIEKESVRLAEMAEGDPFQVLRTRQPRFPTDMPMEMWEAHIKNIMSWKETRPQYIR